jgi:hypothetical protein
VYICTDEDIRLFLLSRYGIDVTVEHVRETVIQGLAGAGGNSDASDDECIDLMEMVAILLIPTILKAAQLETKHTDDGTTTAPRQQLHPKLVLPRPGLLDFVLSMILQDVRTRQPGECNICQFFFFSMEFFPSLFHR